MRDLIARAAPGNKLTLIFTTDNFGGGLGERVQKLLALSGRAISIDGLGSHELESVADRGDWLGIRAISLTVLSGFKSDEFTAATVDAGLIESIQKAGEDRAEPIATIDDPEYPDHSGCVWGGSNNFPGPFGDIDGRE